MAEPIMLVAIAILVAAWAVPFGRLAKRALHLLQLEEYQTARFWRWLYLNPRAGIDPWILTASLTAAIAATHLDPPFWGVVVVLASAGGAWRTRVGGSAPAKKPLVVTARVKRLIVGYAIGGIGITAMVVVAARPAVASASAPVVAAGMLALFVVTLLAWPLASVASLALFPVEAGFRRYYLRAASQILRAYAPTVVGVAGSYGKTSTKTFVAQILATRYPTLATPRSFNTPMGLCRVIRDELRPEHRFFIAELGAYQRGEIEQLCKLVRPRVGILTSVGPEHLERFGSMENVIQAESELFEALPSGGYAIVDGDDPLSREIALRARCSIGIVGGGPVPNRVLWAEDIAMSWEGLRFTLCHRDGDRLAVSTSLLGRHNVGNILLASAAALHCGFDLGELAPAIARLTPVEHRLQLVPNDNGVVVIDDTYNSNPRGAAAALDALASFPDGQRVLVTPGMVELAELQDEAHRDFGRKAAMVCDRVILIGSRRTRAIGEGLAEAGFTSERLIVTKSLAEATERLREVLRRGDTVLFENDLPDNYSE